MKFNLDLYIDAIFTASREDIDAVTEALEDNGIIYDIAQTPFDLQTLWANIEALTEYLTKKY